MRKFLMVFFIAVCLSGAPAGSRQAEAAGIPVIDAAGLSQSIAGYIQMLADYSEQLNQLNVMANQYATQVQQYQRELEEYSHYLEQIKRMGAVLDAADWNKVLNDAYTYYGQGQAAQIPHMDIRTEVGRTNVQTVMKTGMTIPEKVEDAIDLYQAQITGYEMPGFDQENHARNRYHVERYVDRQMAVAGNQEDRKERARSIEIFKEAAEGLPNDSDLRTQQLIAQQTAFLLTQNEILIGHLNQLVAGQEPFSEYAAAQDARAKEIAHRQSQKHQSNYLPSALGSTAWKNF